MGSVSSWNTGDKEKKIMCKFTEFCVNNRHCMEDQKNIYMSREKELKTLQTCARVAGITTVTSPSQS
jgi:hypothetical protein